MGPLPGNTSLPGNSGASSRDRAVTLADVGQGAVIVPSASTIGISALVSGEIVDHDTSVAFVVERASAAGARAGSGGGAIILSNVEQLTIPVVPGTSAIGIGALVAREDVDQDAISPSIVFGTGTSCETTRITPDEYALGSISLDSESRDIASGSNGCISDTDENRDESGEGEEAECHCE